MRQNLPCDKDALRIELERIKSCLYGATLSSAGHWDVISTGSVELDKALGIGGWPRGSIVEIFGEPAAGKSAVALRAAASVHALNGTVAVMDAENSLDLHFAKTLGVDTAGLLVSKMSCCEHVLSVCCILAESCAVDLIIVDSVAALASLSELGGAVNGASDMENSRIMSFALRRLSSAARKSGALIMFLNQTRISPDDGRQITPGGRSLGFYSAIRVDLKHLSYIKTGNRTIGCRIGARVIKNTLSAPYRQAEFSILFDQGVKDLEGLT